MYQRFDGWREGEGHEEKGMKVEGECSEGNSTCWVIFHEFGEGNQRIASQGEKKFHLIKLSLSSCENDQYNNKNYHYRKETTMFSLGMYENMQS